MSISSTLDVWTGTQSPPLAFSPFSLLCRYIKGPLFILDAVWKLSGIRWFRIQQVLNLWGLSDLTSVTQKEDCQFGPDVRVGSRNSKSAASLGFAFSILLVTNSNSEKFPLCYVCFLHKLGFCNLLGLPFDSTDAWWNGFQRGRKNSLHDV